MQEESADMNYTLWTITLRCR